MTEPIKRTVTAYVILNHYSRHTPVNRVCDTLLKNGVAKGTVSKVGTVLAALYDGLLQPEQVTSLNHAYHLIKCPGVNLTDEELVELYRGVAGTSINPQHIAGLRRVLEAGRPS